MKILKNRFSFLLLICFIACNQGLKEVQSTPEKVVLNGQFPIHLPIPKSINHQNHFKVTDTKTKVSYPAQRWDEQALVF